LALVRLVVQSVLHPLHSERDNVTALAELRDRVTDLEARVDEVEKLARGTDREVADWRQTLNNHTNTLNTIRLNQVDQGKTLTRLEKEMRDGFAKVEDKFELIRQGQEQITDLLTWHLGELDEETSTGGADE
jgi:hypothetical protein